MRSNNVTGSASRPRYNADAIGATVCRLFHGGMVLRDAMIRLFLGLFYFGINYQLAFKKPFCLNFQKDNTQMSERYATIFNIFVFARFFTCFMYFLIIY